MKRDAEALHCRLQLSLSTFRLRSLRPFVCGSSSVRTAASGAVAVAVTRGHKRLQKSSQSMDDLRIMSRRLSRRTEPTGLGYNDLICLSDPTSQTLRAEQLRSEQVSKLEAAAQAEIERSSDRI